MLGATSPSIEVGGNDSGDMCYLNRKTLDTNCNDANLSMHHPSLGHAFAYSNGSRRVDKRFTVGTKSLIDNGIAIVDYGDCDFSFETINIRDFDNPLEIAKQ